MILVQVNEQWWEKGIRFFARGSFPSPWHYLSLDLVTFHLKTGQGSSSQDMTGVMIPWKWWSSAPVSYPVRLTCSRSIHYRCPTEWFQDLILYEKFEAEIIPSPLLQEFIENQERRMTITQICSTLKFLRWFEMKRSLLREWYSGSGNLTPEYPGCYDCTILVRISIHKGEI